MNVNDLRRVLKSMLTSESSEPPLPYFDSVDQMLLLTPSIKEPRPTLPRADAFKEPFDENTTVSDRMKFVGRYEAVSQLKEFISRAYEYYQLDKNRKNASDVIEYFKRKQLIAVCSGAPGIGKCNNSSLRFCKSCCLRVF